MLDYKHIPAKARIVFATLALSFAILLTIVSLQETTAVATIAHFDKVTHIGAYFVLAALLVPALRRGAAAIIIATLFGVLIETVQGLMTQSRNADILDALANFIGAMLGAGLWLAMARRQNTKSP